ncbi:putative iron-sulfur-binding oxidoreductase FadF [Labrys miyagiensis]
MQGPDLAGLVLLLAIAGLIVQAARLWLRWRKGRPAPVDWIAGIARLPRGYFHTVHDVVDRDPYASRMHVLAAGGLVAALVLSFILHVGGFGGAVGIVLAVLVLATLGAAAAGVCLVAWRRRPPRPRRLTGGKFDLLPLALGGAVLFLGAAAFDAAWHGAPPPALLPSSILIALVGAASLGTLVAWSLEGPMRHAVAGVTNLVVHHRPRRVEGLADTALRPLDLSRASVPGPDIPQAGVAQPSDFSWTRLVQFDACVQCGRCQEACPAHAAGQQLNPKRLIQDLVGATAAQRGSSRVSLVSEAGAEGAISPETLWACTTCRACVYECPMLIEHVDAIVDMRRYQTLERGAVPPKSAEAIETLRATHTIAGRSLDSRLDWAVDLSVPLMAERGRAEVLLWLGETAFDRRNQRTLRALIQLLRRAGIDFAVLGEEERDCGDLARRLGDEATFQELAVLNIQTLRRYSFEVILTADPHVLHMLRNEYPAFGATYRVEHHSAFLDSLLADGRLAAADLSGEAMTYHDPCYLGRYNGEFAAPRSLLGRLGIGIAEMERSGPRSRCCGGGGGAPLADVPGERRIPDMRIDQARATGAATVAVACPFCAQMLEGVVEPRPKIMDLAEIVLAAVEAAEQASPALVTS